MVSLSISLRRLVAQGLLVLSVLMVAVSPAQAQAEAEKGSRRFVDSVGEFLYSLAWPTAKYDHVEFDARGSANGGADLIARLIGTSGFDGSLLWTDVVLEVKNGTIVDLHWGRHNAILVPPGVTVRALGRAIAELNRQYALNQPPAAVIPSGPDLAAMCVANPTAIDIAYIATWESGQVDQRTLKAGTAKLYWMAASQPRLTLRFDASYEPGMQLRQLTLVAHAARAGTTACGDVARYDFQTDGRSIEIAPS